MKIIVATHGKLAEGFKYTLDYITSNICEIITLSAYVENIPVDEEIESIFLKIDKNEQVIILTDLASGSVNQAFSLKLGRPNTYIISGINFPLLLSIAMESLSGDIREEKIREIVEESKEQIIFVNDSVSQLMIDEDDE